MSVADYAEFQVWSAAQGIITNSKVIVQDVPLNEGGRGLVANADIAAGEEIARIPLTSIITGAAVRNSDFQTRYLSTLAEPISDRDAVMLFFLYESSKADGRFRPFMNIMPATYDTPFWFTPDEFEELKATNLYTSTELKRAHYKQLYSTTILKLRASFPEVFTEEHYSYDRLIWAHSVYWSRSFSILIGGKPTEAFIPFCDFTNHKLGTHISWITDDVNGFFSYVTDQPVPAGTQVFNNYGAKTNEEMLYNYGFIVDDNKFNSYFVKLAISEQDPLYRLKTMIVRQRNLSLEHYIFADKFPAQLFEVMRIMACDPMEMYFLEEKAVAAGASPASASVDAAAPSDSYRRPNPASADAGLMISGRNEIQMLRTFLSLLSDRLQRLRVHDAQEDRRRLREESETLSYRMKCILDYRAGQIEVVELALEKIQTLYYETVRALLPTASSLLSSPAFQPGKLVPFLDWLKSAGLKTNFHIDAEGKPRVSSALPADGVIFSAPTFLLLTLPALKKTAFGRILKHIDGVDDTTALTLFLAHSHAIGAKSSLHPWMSALPESLTTGLLLDDEQMMMLSGTSLLDEIEGEKENLQEEYDSLFPMLSEELPSQFPEDKLTAEAYAYARSIVETRSIEVDGLSDDIEVIVCPLAGVFPHNPFAQTSYRLTADKQSIEFTTSVPMVEGEIIYDNLGALSNDRLVSTYGSYLTNNEADTVLLQISAEDDEDERRQNVLDANFLGLEHFIRQGHVPERLLRALRICLLEDDELVAVEARPGMRINPGEQISAKNEAAARESLTQMLEFSLEAAEEARQDAAAEEGAASGSSSMKDEGEEEDSSAKICNLYATAQLNIIRSCIEIVKKME